ncbi:surface-anchored protein [Salana multivorans]|uniref:Surface-anchored protein n=1 Tax=Salana multivorans TaxID=120377 RepID=A0A3N2DE08_9MICO|nr:choice-of-anchor M domain-containing protein [Salana multivorans]ROR97664.1 surface-anchored protein [Salana multivorans]
MPPATRSIGAPAALLIASVALLAVPAALLTAPASAAPADPLVQTVAPDEATGEGRVVISSGHVDLGPRMIDGRWTLQLRDDTLAPPVWRSLDDVVLQLPDSSILPAPDDVQFDFIDAAPGSDVWVIPQTQNTAVVWAGWNSQHPSAVEVMGGGMTLRLLDVEGPGQFTLFLQSGNFDPAQLLWDSGVDGPQDIWALTNTHVHGNWVFTEPGVYLLDVEVLADLADGTVASDRETLRIAVSDATDPEDAFGAGLPGADEAGSGSPGRPTDGASGASGSTDAGDATGSGTDDPASASSASAPSAEDVSDGRSDGASGVPTAAVIAGGAVVLVGAAVAASAARARGARRQVEGDVEPDGDPRE